MVEDDEVDVGRLVMTVVAGTEEVGLKKLRHGRGNRRSVSASYVPIYTQNLYLIFVGL